MYQAPTQAPYNTFLSTGQCIQRLSAFGGTVVDCCKLVCNQAIICAGSVANIIEKFYEGVGQRRP